MSPSTACREHPTLPYDKGLLLGVKAAQDMKPIGST